MKTYVLYHSNCWDGFCAAWVARMKLGESAEYIPVQYGYPIPEMEMNSVVYLLDFSYKRQEMRDILSRMHKVIVLDHHKTAMEELDGLTDEFVLRPDLIQNQPGSELPVVHFDMNKSGARLTWEYFYKNAKSPWLVDYTEDRDLWRHKLNMTREINAYIRSYPLDFNRFDVFNTIDGDSDEWITMIKAGGAILRREQQIIDDHIRNAREINMDGYNVLAVNATVLFSDIAGKLSENRPFGVCYFDNGKERIYSLRSRGSIDVSEIAKKHGGGGHKGAAGFKETL